MFEHLKAMAIFAKVVDLGSFRAAADVLGMAPSVVSRHVSELEQHLDCALLYRSTRRMSVTEQGQKIYEVSASMLAVAQDGVSELMEQTEQLSGRLTVSLPATVFETGLCAEAVAAFCSDYANVDLSLNYSDKKLDLIGSGFDLAIRVGIRLDDSRYRARQLCSLQRSIVVSPCYAKLAGEPRNLKTLARLKWIKLTQFSPAGQLISPKGEVPAFDPPVAIETDSVGALRSFALAGMGAAAVPRVVVEGDIKAGNLLDLDVGWPLMAPGVHAIWPGNATRSSLASRFIAHLANWFQECGWSSEQPGAE